MGAVNCPKCSRRYIARWWGLSTVTAPEATQPCKVDGELSPRGTNVFKWMFSTISYKVSIFPD